MNPFWSTVQLACAFLAGTALVALAALVARRTFRRDPGLEGRRENVLQLVERPRRQEALETELGRSRLERENLRLLFERQQAAHHDRIVGVESPSTRIVYTALAVVLGFGEAMVFVLLAVTSNLFQLPHWLWAFVAPPLTAVLILFLHALVGNILQDKHRPEATIRRAKIGATISGILVLVAAYGVISGRTVTNASVLEWLVTVSMWVLASLLSITASMCTIIATTLWEKDRAELELVELGTLGQTYSRHIALLEEEQARLAGPEHPTAPVVVRDGAAAGNGARLGQLVGAVMIFASLAHTSAAQPIGNRNGPTTSTNATCAFLIDVTGSGSRKARRTEAEALSRNLPAAFRALDCDLVHIVPFAGTMFSGITEFSVPRAEARPCTTSQARNVSAVLYKDVDAKQRAQADSVCKAQLAADSTRHAAALTMLGDTVGSVLREAAVAPSRGKCTALWHAVDRALTRARHLVVLTDGVSTCPPPRTMVQATAGSSVHFVLIPLDGGDDVNNPNAIMARVVAVKRRYAFAEVLLAGEMTADYWRRLGQSTR